MKICGRLSLIVQAMAVAIFLAMSSTAHSGGPEWEAHIKQALAALQHRNYQAAEVSLAAAMEEAEALGESDERLAITLSVLGGLHLSRGDYPAAEPVFERLARALASNSFDLEDPRVAAALNNLGTFYISQERYTEAEPIFKRSISIRETLGREDSHLAACLNNLAMVYRAQRKYTDAEPLMRRSVGILKKVGDRKNLEMAMRNMTALYISLGWTSEAAQASREIDELKAEGRGEVAQSENSPNTLTIRAPR